MTKMLLLVLAYDAQGHCSSCHVCFGGPFLIVFQDGTLQFKISMCADSPWEVNTQLGLDFELFESICALFGVHYQTLFVSVVAMFLMAVRDDSRFKTCERAWEIWAWLS